jgi:O-antigen/teichoic acid export membrane protein
MNIFNASQASFGNLNTQVNPKKKLEIFLNLNFLAFWFFGGTALCLYILLNPFISLWIGSDKTIDQYIVLLIVINYFLVGMRVPLGIMKAAAGIFSQDKYVPLIQSAINLIASIILVQYLGLAGVFMGTILSSILLPFWHRPMIVYRYVFDVSSIEYFIKYFQFSLVVVFNTFLAGSLIDIVFKDEISYMSFFFSLMICLIVPNILIVLFFYKSKEFQYVIFVMKSVLVKVLKK